MHEIYKWFVGLYHTNLWDYLVGFDCNYDLTAPNQFNGWIGIVTLVVALLFACLFYFVRHARFNGFFSWLVILLLVAAFSWGYGYGIVKHQESDIPNYVIYGMENCVGSGDCYSLQAQDGAWPQVTNATFVGFGFANMFIGMIYFILFSFVLKRFSRDCRHTPWPSLWPKH